MRQFLKHSDLDTVGGKSRPAKVVSLAPGVSMWLFRGIWLSKSETKTYFLGWRGV